MNVKIEFANWEYFINTTIEKIQYNKKVDAKIKITSKLKAPCYEVSDTSNIDIIIDRIFFTNFKFIKKINYNH